MNRQMLQHEFAPGRYLWLGMAVVIGLALATQAATAKECHRQPLTASAMRAELPGYTFYTGPMNIFIAADGVLYGTVKRGPDGASEQDVGTWHITPEGQWCRTWRWWDNRRERCHIVYREGETFELSVKDRFFGTGPYRRVPGNPEGY
ncbi:MAG TPA: hypothetical protein VGC99_23175 [Candidatus Tectomicrobia bacterium]